MSHLRTCSAGRRRRALTAAFAAAFVACVTLAPAHVHAHVGTTQTCATCHVVRHVPAVVHAAPALTIALHAQPAPQAPSLPRPQGAVPSVRSRGPPC